MTRAVAEEMGKGRNLGGGGVAGRVGLPSLSLHEGRVSNAASQRGGPWAANLDAKTA